jgi:hypothetical protein
LRRFAFEEPNIKHEMMIKNPRMFVSFILCGRARSTSDEEVMEKYQQLALMDDGLLIQVLFGTAKVSDSNQLLIR